MTNKIPLITVGFTCFNAEDTISYAIESAQQQNWANIEILVVDDGSKDNSLNIVKNLAKKDNRIRLIEHQVNKGTAAARNSIARNAKGEYLCFFDDDDKSMPDRLEKQFKRIEDYKRKHQTDLIFCYCDRHVVKSGENDIDHYGYGIGRESPEPFGPYVADACLWMTGTRQFPNEKPLGQMGSGTMMMPTRVFGIIGYFDERFRRSAEWDLAIRAALKGAHFISCPEPLIIQFKTPTQDKLGRKPLEYGLMLRRKNKEYLKSKGVYLTSLFVAYGQFHNSKGRKIFADFYLIIACLISPGKMLWPRIKRRFSGSN